MSMLVPNETVNTPPAHPDVVKRRSSNLKHPPDMLRMLQNLRETIQKKLALVSTVKHTLECNIDHLDDIIAQSDQLTLDDLFSAVAKLEAATTVPLEQFQQLCDQEQIAFLANNFKVTSENCRPKLNGILKSFKKSEISEEPDAPALTVKNSVIGYGQRHGISTGAIRIHSDEPWVGSKGLQISAETSVLEIKAMALGKFNKQNEKLSDYYIAEMTGKVEREMNDDEKPLEMILSAGTQFDSVQYHLKKYIKEAVLKIHILTDSKASQLFCSVYVTLSTTVHDVLKSAMEKFKIVADVMDYSLYEVINGGEKLLGMKENILQRKIDIERKGVEVLFRLHQKKMDGKSPVKVLDVVSALQEIPENRVCADCDKPDPYFVSLNWGVLLCRQCADIHGTLSCKIAEGTRLFVSRIRPLKMPKWESDHAKILQERGNKPANTFLERKLLYSGVAKPAPDSEQAERREYIITKYIRRKFVQSVLVLTNSDSFTPSSESDLSLTSGVTSGGTTVSSTEILSAEQKLNIFVITAIQNGDVNRVLEILNSGLDLEVLVPDPTDGVKKGWLHFAAIAGETAVAELLIYFGSYPGARDENGRTALYYAAQYGHELLASRLKEYQYFHAYMNNINSSVPTSPSSSNSMTKPRRLPFKPTPLHFQLSHLSDMEFDTQVRNITIELIVRNVRQTDITPASPPSPKMPQTRRRSQSMPSEFGRVRMPSFSESFKKRPKRVSIADENEWLNGYAGDIFDLKKLEGEEWEELVCAVLGEELGFRELMRICEGLKRLRRRSVTIGTWNPPVPVPAPAPVATANAKSGAEERKKSVDTTNAVSIDVSSFRKVSEAKMTDAEDWLTRLRREQFEEVKIAQGERFGRANWATAMTVPS